MKILIIYLHVIPDELNNLNDVFYMGVNMAKPHKAHKVIQMTTVA